MLKEDFICVLDDTGFDASKTNSQVLQNEDVTYVGLVMQEYTYGLLKNFMAAMCAKLYKTYGSSEFHFTDMYNQKGKFKNLSKEEFLEIVETFAEAIHTFDIDIFTQTVPKNIFEQNEALDKGIQHALEILQMKKSQKNKNFILSLTQLKRFMSAMYIQPKLKRIICDEGIRKADSSLEFQFKGSSDSMLVDFKSSAQTPVLQMADFAAWMLTRSKQILSKKGEELNKVDMSILQCFKNISPSYANLALVVFSPEDWKGYFPYDIVVETLAPEK